MFTMPNNTVTTATITLNAGNTYLATSIDGEGRCLKVDTHHVALRNGYTVTDEATRLLRRHAGYLPTSDWRETTPGTWVVTVAEVDDRCLTCVHGCSCGIGDTGCGHYGCWVANETTANTCVSAVGHVAARRPSYRPARRSRTARR